MLQNSLPILVIIILLSGCKNSYQQAFEEITEDPYRLVLEPSWEDLMEFCAQNKGHSAYVEDDSL